MPLARLTLVRRALLVLIVALTACAHTAPESRATERGERSERQRGSAEPVARPHGAVQEGQCSWYGREQHGHLTANGEHFDMYAFTAAHRTLPMQTRVRVTNLKNGRSVVVRINDRGPYSRRRIIDVSFAAAKSLGMLDAGVVPARVEVLGR